MVMGSGDRLREQRRELEKAKAGLVWLCFCVCYERGFERRLGSDSLFRVKKGAPRLRVVKGTE